jgi:hypothetical protein
VCQFNSELDRSKSSSSSRGSSNNDNEEENKKKVWKFIKKQLFKKVSDFQSRQLFLKKWLKGVQKSEEKKMFLDIIALAVNVIII